MRDWRLIPAKKRQIQMERMPHKQVVRRSGAKAGAETDQTARTEDLSGYFLSDGIAHTYMAAEGLEKAARANIEHF